VVGVARGKDLGGDNLRREDGEAGATICVNGVRESVVLRGGGKRLIRRDGYGPGLGREAIPGEGSRVDQGARSRQYSEAGEKPYSGKSPWKMGKACLHGQNQRKEALELRGLPGRVREISSSVEKKGLGRKRGRKTADRGFQGGPWTLH